MPIQKKIRLGISACLLGEKVRYFGGHKLDPFLRDTLGRVVDYVPLCPEVECGLTVPRETMRLVGCPEEQRLVTVGTGTDHTVRMREWGGKRLEELTREGLCGYIFKSRSPSCGMERVKVYGDRRTDMNGVGVWARMVMERFPHLAVEDEERLNDPEIRDNFIERIFVFGRWRELTARDKTLDGLVSFHNAHRPIIMARSHCAYRELDAIVASGSGRSVDELFDEYFAAIAETMKLRSRS